MQSSPPLYIFRFRFRFPDVALLDHPDANLRKQATERLIKETNKEGRSSVEGRPQQAYA
jgi:hypothetical protein